MAGQYEYSYRGHSLEDLKKLEKRELAELLTSRERRKLKRGLGAEEQRLLKKLSKKSKAKTHCRDMIVLPSMVGKTILVHSGKEFTAIIVVAEMIGHRLGEFVLTRKRVGHSAPGVGATKSSASVSVR